MISPPAAITASSTADGSLFANLTQVTEYVEAVVLAKNRIGSPGATLNGQQ
jgi:hypothetical protein